MNTDVVLGLFLAAFAVFPSVIGVEMANKPPNNDKKLLWRYRIAFIVVALGTIVTAGVQITRNLHEQERLQRESTAQNSALTLQLQIIKELAEHPPAGTSESQIASAIKTISHLNLPSGESTNAELKTKGWELTKRMMQLDAKKKKDGEDLLEYWKPGVPDTYERHRIQEFNGLDANAAFEFKTYIAGDYVCSAPR